MWTEDQKEIFGVSDDIGVIYSAKYYCKLCGYIPKSHGCIPALDSHMRTEHNIEPPDGKKYFWMMSLSNHEIHELVERLKKLEEGEQICQISIKY